MILIYIFLGHFIGDFLLQPNNLVAWKNKSWKGVAVHASIHFLVMSLLLYIYLPTVAIFLISLPVALVHFVIDSLKAAHERKSRHSFVAYWVDQGCHYTSLIVTYLIGGQYVLAQTHPIFFSGIGGPLFSLYINPAVLIFLSLAVFSTLTIEFSYYRDRQKTSKNLSPLNYSGMFRRLLILSIIYISLFLLYPASITAIVA